MSNEEKAKELTQYYSQESDYKECMIKNNCYETGEANNNQAFSKKVRI